MAGRTDASLVTVYTSSSLNQTLDYDLAEANGYMQNTRRHRRPEQQNAHDHRREHRQRGRRNLLRRLHPGSTGEYDSLSFNGTALGNPTNDVAQGTDANFGPSVVSSNVTSSLSGTNTVQYSVAMTGGEDNLGATVGLLAVTHPLSVNGVWSGTGGGSWKTAATGRAAASRPVPAIRPPSALASARPRRRLLWTATVRSAAWPSAPPAAAVTPSAAAAATPPAC